MERDEAKHILSLCRPENDEDRTDPVIAQALALLETDAELRTWFEDEQAADARIAKAFESIEPTADLKASILAGMRAHAQLTEDETDNIVAFEDPTPTTATAPTAPTAPKATSTRLPVWIGIAACFAILFGVIVSQQNISQQPHLASADTVVTAGAPDVVKFLAERIGNLQSAADLDVQDPQIAPLRAHLTSLGAPTPHSVPNQLDVLPTLGCIAFDYKDCKLSMICFKNDGVYHLITAHKDSIGCASSPEPQFFEVDGQAFKLWAEGDQVYIIAVEGTTDNLPEFI